MLSDSKDCCRVNKNPQLDPVHGQLNPVRALTPYDSEAHFDFILPSTSKSYIPLAISDQIVVSLCISQFPMRAEYSAYLISL